MKYNTHLFWAEQMKFRKHPVHLRTQVCVCRNLEGYIFPSQTSEIQRSEVLEKIRQALYAYPEFINGAEEIAWQSLGPYEKRVFQSLYGLEDPWSETVIWVHHKNNIQVIVNDGDHIRFQSTSIQTHAYKTLQNLLNLETALEEHLTYAFDPMQGYLTCNPQTLGTGIRIHQRLHVPGLCLMQQLSRVKASVSEMDLEFEPIKVIHDKILGHQFTLSTTTTLGVNEKELVEHIEHVGQLITHEEERIRQDLWKNNPIFLKDSISRALGLLNHCYELTYEEAINLLSIVLMAMDTHIIPIYKRSALLVLWHSMQSDILPIFCKKELRPEEEAACRAQCVHSFFSKYANPFENKLEEVSYVA